MSIDINVTQEKGYLFIKVTGEYSLMSFHSLIERVIEETTKSDSKNIMVDISEVTGTIPVMDRFYLAEYASGIWKRDVRVAVVYRANEIDKFFETVAVNRAAQTVVVPDMQSALEWLMGSTHDEPAADKDK